MTTELPPARTPSRPTTPPAREPAPAAPARVKKSFAIESGTHDHARRIVLYGRKGIGKTTLASLAPKPLFIDTESGSSDLDIRRIKNVTCFQDVRDALNEPSLWKDVRTVVIDTATALQDWATQHTLATVKREDKKPVNSIEDYGYGKGYQHVLETFLLVLGDLDAHMRAGRNVIVVCHDTIEKTPNPDGEDFLCYQPSLQQPPKTGRIRDRVAGWCDELLFVQYDIAVTEGKAKGQGTRTLHCQERPAWWAKSRKLRESMDIVENDPAVWDALGLK